MEKKHIRDNFILKDIIMMLLVLIASLVIIFAAYQDRLGVVSQQGVEEMLRESVGAQRVAMEERIDAGFQQLTVVGSELKKNLEELSDAELSERLNEITIDSLFDELAFCQSDGRLVYNDGIVADCSERDYFQKAISGEKNIELLSEENRSNRHIFVFAQPVYKNKKIIGVVVATRSLESITADLEKQEFSKGQYEFLCYEDGEIITHVYGDMPDIDSDADLIGKNIDSFFRNGEEALGKSSFYTYEGEEYYGIYTSSGIDGVYIFSALPEGNISKLAGVTRKWSIVIVAIAFVLTVIVSSIMIWHLKKKIIIAQKKESDRKDKLEKYYSFQNKRFMGRHSSLLRTFYFNLTRNICSQESKGILDTGSEFENGMSISKVCEIICSRIHPNEKEKFLKIMSRDSLTDALKAGISTVKDNFLFDYRGFGYIWINVSADLVINPMTDELEAVLSASVINSEKRIEQIGKKLITEKFDTVALIDAATGYLHTVKDLEKFGTESAEEMKLSRVVYEKSICEKLQNMLSESFFNQIKEKVRLETVLNELENNKDYSVAIHVLNEKQKEVQHYQIRYSYLDEYRESIMIFTEDITDILESRFDIETGLYNTIGFYETVENWIKTNPDRKFRVIRYHIDGFININATYGYEEGNRLIRDIGEYMRTHSGKDSIAGHINSDYFIQFCFEECISPEEYYAQFLKHFEDYDLPYPVAFKIGVYDLCEPDCDIQIMSYKAHLAIQAIEGDFSKSIEYYRKGMMEATHEEHQMLTEVGDSIKNEQFEIWFQPQIDYSNGDIIGAEALVRWRHPKLGFLYPGEFIPILERSKQISVLDEYIWNKAGEYLGRWNDQGIGIPLSVNVSRMDINDPNLYDTLEGIVKKYNIPPCMFRLEITESAYMQQPENLAVAVRNLRNMGFVVEMDDFGSGYSSLNALKDLEIDVLKLDMKLVSEIGTGNRKNEDILKAVVQMAFALNMSVIAEGVETKVQADYLKSIDCTDMQGYFFSRPITANQMESILKNKKQS